jgi:hypothetical protein
MNIITAKNGGTLFGKTFIPFRKEWGIGDEGMTNIIRKQNIFLRLTKQRIVQNLNDIDCPIDIVSGSGEELDAATVSLRDVFYQYKDGEGKQLIDDIEKTNTGVTYRFLFHEKKIELIDNMLNNLDATLDEIVAWEDCNFHYRYMTVYPISVVGRVARATPTALWTNHLSDFKSNGIPTEIDTQELQYSTKKRAPWVKYSYRGISRGNLPATTTVTTIANTPSQGQENNSMGSGTGYGSNRPESQTASPGAITGLSNLKRKMAAIDLKREAFKVDQSSLKKEVSTMARSLEKMVSDIIPVRKYMKKMSAIFRSDIADLKQLILNMSAKKRGGKKSKQSEGSSTSSAEKRAHKSMEKYGDIDHDMATSWTNMEESEGEGDTIDQNNVSQGYSIHIQGKTGKN